MLIYLNAYSQEFICFFQQNTTRPFTNRCKTIFFVASVALGFLAACYLIKRYCVEGSSLKERAYSVTKKEETPNENFDSELQHPELKEQLDKVKAQQLIFEQEKVKKFQAQLEGLIDQIKTIDLNRAIQGQTNELPVCDQKSPFVLRIEKQIAQLQEKIDKEQDLDKLQGFNRSLQNLSGIKESLARQHVSKVQHQESVRASLFQSIDQLIKLHLMLGTSKQSIGMVLQDYCEQYPEIEQLANDLKGK